MTNHSNQRTQRLAQAQEEAYARVQFHIKELESAYPALRLDLNWIAIKLITVNGVTTWRGADAD